MAQQSLAYNYKPDQASSSAGPSGAGLPGAGAGVGAGAGAGLGVGAGAATDPATQGYMGPDGKWVHPPKPTKKAAQGKRETVIRSKGGRVWEDQTLLEWDPCECRTSILLDLLPSLGILILVLILIVITTLG
jgi:hypothetical protein